MCATIRGGASTCTRASFRLGPPLRGAVFSGRATAGPVKRASVAIGFAATLIAFMANSTPRADAPAEVQQLRNSFERNQKVAWTAIERLVMSREPDGLSISSDASYGVTRIGDQWAVVERTAGENFGGGRKIPFAMYMETVSSAGQAVQLQWSPREPPERSKFVASTSPPALTWNVRTSAIVAGALDGLPPSGNPIQSYLGHGALVFGYIDPGSRLADVLSGGERVHDQNDPELSNCVVIESKTDRGMYKAWLDPAHALLPRRIHVRTAGSDKLLDGKPLSSAPRDRPGSIYPTSQLSQIDRLVDNVKFAEFGGAPVIKAFRNVTTDLYADGQKLVKRVDFNIDAFLVPSAESVSLTVPIPDNTPVVVRRDPHIPYVWRDGKIVPDTTPGVARAVEGVRHAPAPRSTTQYVMIALNVVVIGAIVTWIVRRRISTA
jgi:hypothetical protein